MTQKRKRLSGPEKIAIVKRYLVERIPILDLCDGYGLQPSQISRWQAAIFEHRPTIPSGSAPMR
jgi:transposase-like protein